MQATAGRMVDGENAGNGDSVLGGRSRGGIPDLGSGGVMPPRKFHWVRLFTVWLVAEVWKYLWRFRYFHAFGFSVTILAFVCLRERLDGNTLANTVAILFGSLCGGAAIAKSSKSLRGSAASSSED